MDIRNSGLKYVFALSSLVLCTFRYIGFRRHVCNISTLVAFANNKYTYERIVFVCKREREIDVKIVECGVVAIEMVRQTRINTCTTETKFNTTKNETNHLYFWANLLTLLIICLMSIGLILFIKQ